MASSSTLDAAAGDAIEHVAVPASFTSLQAAVCARQVGIGVKVEPPSRDISNSTVPLGATGLSDPGEGIVTPAVAVICCPVTDGLSTAEIPVVVGAVVTVWVADDEVDPVKLTSPE
jgi:hypothetical protein